MPGACRSSTAMIAARKEVGLVTAGIWSPTGKRNIAVFPLALPAISGPGAIAVVIGISTEIAELTTTLDKAIAYAGTVSSILITCIVIWATFRTARFVSTTTGPDAMEAITRMMGFLLVCIGVQFLASGARTFVGGQ